MLKCLSKLAFAVLLIGQATSVHAQVYNPAAPQAPAGVQTAGGANAPTAGAVEQTGWGIPLPKITMPKITMPNMQSVTGPIKSGFGKVSAGSKKALEGAKEMFSFAKRPATSAQGTRSTGQQKQSIWKRLITRQPEPQVPQTVGEFMSQPRLDP